MKNFYLFNTKYDNEKNRMILYFTENIITQKVDFVYKEKYYPSFYLDLPKKLVQDLLIDFKKKIKIERINSNKIKLIAKNYTTLQKCANILNSASSKNILLIEPERQYLINNNWSYYDSFIISYNNQIKKIEKNTITNININKFISKIGISNKLDLVKSLSKRLLLSNILKIKPEINIKNDEILNILFENNFYENKLVLKNKQKIPYTKTQSIIKNTFELDYYKIRPEINIKNDEILNILFENNFYKNKLVLKNKQKISYIKTQNIIKNTIALDFSKIWPYILQNEFYNIGYETLNCNDCKPKNLSDTNILSSSLVKVRFLRDGLYFLSKDKEWGNEYHKNNSFKENRINYMKQNKIKQLPTGPFFKNETEYIELIDAIDLMNNKNIEILEDTTKLNWTCKNKESFISKIIHDLKNKIQSIETSINLSNSINYNQKNYFNLEKNPVFTQYTTEFNVLNNILEEIPRFMQHTNTKFYDPIVAKSVRLIKKETINKINNQNLIIEQNEKIVIKDKRIIKKINNYFPELNIPIPKIIGL